MFAANRRRSTHTQQTAKVTTANRRGSASEIAVSRRTAFVTDQSRVVDEPERMAGRRSEKAAAAVSDEIAPSSPSPHLSLSSPESKVLAAKKEETSPRRPQNRSSAVSTELYPTPWPKASSRSA